MEAGRSTPIRRPWPGGAQHRARRKPGPGLRREGGAAAAPTDHAAAARTARRAAGGHAATARAGGRQSSYRCSHESWVSNRSGRRRRSPGRVSPRWLNAASIASIPRRSERLAAGARRTRIAPSVTMTWPGAASRFATTFLASRGRRRCGAIRAARSASALAHTTRTTSMTDFNCPVWRTRVSAGSPDRGYCRRDAGRPLQPAVSAVS